MSTGLDTRSPSQVLILPLHPHGDALPEALVRPDLVAESQVAVDLVGELRRLSDRPLAEVLLLQRPVKRLSFKRNQQNRRRQSWRPACACPPHPPAGERESRDHGQDTRSVKIGVRPTGRNLSTILTEPGAADVFTVKDIAQREGLEQVCIRTVQREGDPCGERLMRPDLAAECDVPCNLVSDGRCVVDLALVKVPGCL